jgi:hypothetical protein
MIQSLLSMTLEKRTIHHADALKWLNEQAPLVNCSMITSMPDISEFSKLTLDEWKAWFINAATLVMSRCDDNGISIFYQTDIKRDGIWVDKSFLIQKAADQVGHSLLAHKIVCRSAPNTVGFGRPAYSHLLCFSKNIRPEVALSFADVLPEAGAVSWTRGMGVKACQLACRMVLKYTKSHTIVDPFCGHGSVLAVANEMGLNAIGVELSLKRAKTAQTFKVPVSEKTHSF